MDQNWIKINKALSWANSALRELFFELYRTQSKERWQDTPLFGDKFMKGIGKEIFAKQQKIQQKLILDGDSTKWDLALFADIYKALRPGKKHIKVHDNLDSIKKIRNQVAHNNSLKIEEKDYNEMRDQLILSIKELNLKVEEFEQIFQKNLHELVGIDEQVKKNYEDQKYEDKLKKLQEFQKGEQIQVVIEMSSQILSNTSISPSMQEKLYCIRSEAYFQTYQKQKTHEKDNDLLINAICDANLVIRENANSLNGYQLLAQCYELQKNQEKALGYYLKCIALDPLNEQFKNKIAEFQMQESHDNSQHHFDPRHQPITFDEVKEQIKEEMKINDKTLDYGKKILIQNDPLYADVLKGHEYRDGSSNLKQDYQMAFKYYSKAAQKGNAEGLFNLAMLMVEGNGTKKNFKTAHALIEEAANQPAKRKLGGFTVPVVGVAEAQQTLGTWYLNGIYLPKNLHLAKEWMEKAYENGNEMAANDLGLLNLHGMGVPQNFAKAESLLLEAYKRGDFNACSNLCRLYLAQDDAANAEKYHNLSKKAGHMKSRMDDKEIMQEINKLQQGGQVMKMDHQQTEKFYQFDQLIQEYEALKNMKVSAVVQRDLRQGYQYSPDLIKKYAEKGSKTAQRLLCAVSYFFKSLEQLNMIDQRRQNVSLIFENLSKAFVLEDYVCSFMQTQVVQIMNLIDQILDKNERNLLDEQVRICLGEFQLRDCEQNIKFLKECIRLYPKNIIFYKLLGQSYSMIQQFKEGVQFIEQAIKLDPSDYVVYYNLPPMLRNLGQNKLAIQEYKKFLELAPRDERKVPECFYSIANCLFCENQNNIKQVVEYYELGKKAEKEQLPVYLPYQSSSKQVLEMNLRIGSFF